MGGTGATSGRAASTHPDPKTYDYAHPTRSCDVVMKGGITSGVVYPFAVCEIARTYRLRSVGGTSAGAIAATAAAAAELGRNSSTGGFRLLAGLPAWLGSGTNLFDLFQPERRTRHLYWTFTAGLGRKGPLRLLFTAAAAIWNFPLWALLGVAPGIVLLVFSILRGAGFLEAWGVVSGVLLALVGLIVCIVVGLYVSAVRNIPRNKFGLCSGFALPKPGKPAALTPWLSEQLERWAGFEGPGPLTFGHLWQGPDGAGTPDNRTINLEMMTTSLTHGRPYRLPLQSRLWFFDPVELRELFPAYVVEWMETNPPDPPEDDDERRWWEVQCRLLSPLVPLPDASDFPVVVAARMSLSFPVLISAVPLWAVDWTRTFNQDQRKAWAGWLDGVDWDSVKGRPDSWEGRPSGSIHPTRCWFSDGGITSNFPVHFFDAPIPTRPTFAINLRPFHPDHPPQLDECENVWMPSGNEGGIAAWWNDIEVPSGLKSLINFGHTIADTMQNWVDNTQIRVPGYRDRVAHINHTKEEGGMNLNMPAARVTAMSERGRCAGAELARRFAIPPALDTDLTWDNHRWVRYRSAMALMEGMIGRFATAYAAPTGPGEQTYQQLIDRAESDPPRSYRWKRIAQRTLADTETSSLEDVARAVAGSNQSLVEGSPQPLPELRIRPRD